MINATDFLYGALGFISGAFTYAWTHKAWIKKISDDVSALVVAVQTLATDLEESQK